MSHFHIKMNSAKPETENPTYNALYIQIREKSDIGRSWIQTCNQQRKVNIST
jgi:hypothetical protein